jgi:ABC-2 type transport system ATP-binding protein
VLVLDEPASGLDPRARVELRELLAELAAMGKTVVISSHILAEMEEMCTEVAILEAGQLVASGTPSDIADKLGSGRDIRVRLAGGDIATYTVTSELEQHQLLRRLIDEGQEVVEFTQVGRGLEELFMRLTQGTVQ